MATSTPSPEPPDRFRDPGQRYRTLLEINNAIISSLTREALFRAIATAVGRVHNFAEMVGSSPALRAVLATVDKVAPTGSTVLISGETGTGKELIARAVHSRITTNAALNKRRGKRRQLETSLEDDLPTWKVDGHREGDRAFLLADWSDRPDTVLLAREGRATLDAALARLPDDYRAVVVLRDVEELSNEEAAEILGGSVASVKSRLHRARVALREQLTREMCSPRTSITRNPGACPRAR